MIDVIEYNSNNEIETLLTKNCRCHYHSGPKSRLIGNKDEISLKDQNL